MSSPTPLEHVILHSAVSAMSTALGHTPSALGRLEVLEAAAGRLGGWDLNEYRARFGGVFELPAKRADRAAEAVISAIATTRVPPALALCSLARPEPTSDARRKDGVYYTDFRLASYIASRAACALSPRSHVLDPASGTGILLAATVMKVCGNDRRARSRLLREGICAADLSADALRGVRLALASLTPDLGAIELLNARLRVKDSLLEGVSAWADVAPAGFDCVIGNPPWEKVKVSRHEVLLANGADRHYGDDYATSPIFSQAMDEQRKKAARYALTLSERFPLSRSGEADLYKAFVALSMDLVSDTGHIGLLVPAGLIRSQGTRQLREALLNRATRIDLTVLENRARFFAIDTRFKFLVLEAGLVGRKHSPLFLRHGHGTDTGIEETGVARIGRKRLVEVRPDLTIPEVRSDSEWRLFQTLVSRGIPLGCDESPWQPRIVREVDMTRDRKRFVRSPGARRLPLVEGRMVHQFRIGAKSYRSGTGRRAIWDTNPIGASTLRPQFFIDEGDLPASARGRHDLDRAGFCDVTGQTNERTILAARIPKGVVCGNKVPTVTFTGRARGISGALDLWVAIANSVTFDWLARRVVTTTVNFFLLLGLPFPKVPPDSLPGRRLATLARELGELDTAGHADPWLVARKRAAIDVQVAIAFELTFDDLDLILCDFPLLDRGQPPILGEDTSTVTQDLILADFSAQRAEPDRGRAERVKQARKAGAVPYVPAQYVDGDELAETVELSRDQMRADYAWSVNGG